MLKYEEILTWLAQSDWPVIIFLTLFYLKNKKELLGSLRNDATGFSGRKLTALFSVITAAKLSVLIAMTKPENELVYAWLAFGALCLSIVTAQQVLDFKNSRPKTETIDSSIEIANSTTTVTNKDATTVN